MTVAFNQDKQFSPISRFTFLPEVERRLRCEIGPLSLKIVGNLESVTSALALAPEAPVLALATISALPTKSALSTTLALSTTSALVSTLALVLRTYTTTGPGNSNTGTDKLEWMDIVYGTVSNWHRLWHRRIGAEDWMEVSGALRPAAPATTVFSIALHCTDDMLLAALIRW